MSNPILKLVARRTLATYRRKRCTEINGVIHLELKKPSKAPARKSEILRKGTVIQRGGLPLPSDVQVEWDVLVTMRDGAVLLTDIFKPVDETSVPAIVAWSPYGKRDQMAFLTKGIGTQLSGLQKFEAPEAASL